MRTVVAVVLIVVGLLWTLQGLGLVGGSPMTGVTLWVVVGPIVAVAGVWLLFRARRSQR